MKYKLNRHEMVNKDIDTKINVEIDIDLSIINEYKENVSGINEKTKLLFGTDWFNCKKLQ